MNPQIVQNRILKTHQARFIAQSAEIKLQVIVISAQIAVQK